MSNIQTDITKSNVEMKNLVDCRIVTKKEVEHKILIDSLLEAQEKIEEKEMNKSDEDSEEYACE